MTDEDYRETFEELPFSVIPHAYPDDLKATRGHECGNLETHDNTGFPPARLCRNVIARE